MIEHGCSVVWCDRCANHWVSESYTDLGITMASDGWKSNVNVGEFHYDHTCPSCSKDLGVQ
jgi:hypothetical protein